MVVPTAVPTDTLKPCTTHCLRRSVDEDGSPESEYTVALAWALVGRRVVPRVHGWTGPPPQTVRLVR